MAVTPSELWKAPRTAMLRGGAGAFSVINTRQRSGEA
jgi:hypothetical protein